MISFPSRIKSYLVGIMLASYIPIHSPYYSDDPPKNSASTGPFRVAAPEAYLSIHILCSPLYLKTANQTFTYVHSKESCLSHVLFEVK